MSAYTFSSLGEFTVSASDIHSFASFSGDFNKIHIDPVAARRSLFGTSISHGVITVIKSLQLFFKNSDRYSDLNSICVKFNKPVLPEASNMVFVSEVGGEVRIRVGNLNAPLVEISFHGTEEKRSISYDTTKAFLKSDSANLSLEDVSFFVSTEACAVSAKTHENTKWLVDLPGHLSVIFASLSRVIGMKCPGELSLFLGFELAFGRMSNPLGAVTISAEKIDPRFNLVTLTLDADGLTGKVLARLRQPATTQLSFGMIKQTVQENAFSDWHAIVFGGSRGIGEVLVKTIAAGGGSVSFSYASGLLDAKAIVADISNDVVKPRLEYFQWDYNSAEELPCNFGGFTHFFYCCSPKILRVETDQDCEAAFDNFCRAYVEGLETAVRTTAKQGKGTACNFFNISTAFIDSPPPGFVEYANSKYLSEVKLKELSSEIGFSQMSFRFPPLKTDQTSELKIGNTLDVFPEILKMLQAVDAL